MSQHEINVVVRWTGLEPVRFWAVRMKIGCVYQFRHHPNYIHSLLYLTSDVKLLISVSVFLERSKWMNTNVLSLFIR